MYITQLYAYNSVNVTMSCLTNPPPGNFLAVIFSPVYSPMSNCPQYSFQISNKMTVSSYLKQIRCWLVRCRMVREEKELTSMFLYLFYMAKEYPG